MIRQLFWLAIVIAGCAILYSWIEAENEPKQQQVEREIIPDYVAFELVRSSFNKDGNLTGLIRANQMAQYEQLGQIQFEQPAYSIYEAELPHWQISADSGVMYLDDKVLLEQNVVVDNLQTNQLFQKLETPQLEYLLDTQRLQTNAGVEITGDGFAIQGQGVTIELLTRNITLKQHNGTIYRNEQ
jgi:lipopolysaccharide export system protein LptC